MCTGALAFAALFVRVYIPCITTAESNLVESAPQYIEFLIITAQCQPEGVKVDKSV